MTDLDRELCFAPDREDFVDRLPEPAILAADVTDVPPALGSCNLGQLQHFAAIGVDPRIVFQPGGEPQRTSVEFTLEQHTHRVHLERRRRALEIASHNCVTNRPVPRVKGHVYRAWRGRERIHRRRQRHGMPAILPGDDCGDPLAHDGQCAAVGQESIVVMAVRVNEARRQHATTAVDHRIARNRLDTFTHRND